MKFKKTNINDVTRPKYKLEAVFEEFMNMNVKCVEVTDHHYMNNHSAANTLDQGAKRWAKNVKVKYINGKVYLVRTDM